MRAIIIDDKDARALLDSLALKKMQLASPTGRPFIPPEATHEQIVEQLHSQFLFTVCRWFQDQGANYVRI